MLVLLVVGDYDEVVVGENDSVLEGVGWCGGVERVKNGMARGRVKEWEGGRSERGFEGGGCKEEEQVMVWGQEEEEDYER